ncbi:MAG: hypothetical protein KIT68_02480 [Phycisphaeraceae bacterium]|nr:hypothetical protein [Phycisphaeraceae bacterium]
MWIDRVVSLERGRRLVAIKNVSLAEEHLHDHFAPDAARALPALPVMPASLILEGLAQSGGLLVGHAEDFRYKVVLAKIGKASIDRDAAPGCTLRYTATIERMDDQGAAVACTVEIMDHARAPSGPGAAAAFEPAGSADLMFSHLDNNRGAGGTVGEDFPAHNFVFGEAFKTLLAASAGTTR